MDEHTIELLIKVGGALFAIVYFVWKLMALSKGMGKMEEKVEQLMKNQPKLKDDIDTVDTRITTEADKTDKQFEKVYERLNTSDNRVSSIESTVASIKDGQIRIENKLDRLIERFGDK